MKKERIYRLLNVSAAVILLTVVLAAVLPVFVCDQFRIAGCLWSLSCIVATTFL